MEPTTAYLSPEVIQARCLRVDLSLRELAELAEVGFARLRAHVAGRYQLSDWTLDRVEWVLAAEERALLGRWCLPDGRRPRGAAAPG